MNFSPNMFCVQKCKISLGLVLFIDQYLFVVSYQMNVHKENNRTTVWRAFCEGGFRISKDLFKDFLFRMRETVLTSSTTLMLMFSKHWMLLLFLLFLLLLTHLNGEKACGLNPAKPCIHLCFCTMIAESRKLAWKCHSREGVMIDAIYKTSFFVLMQWGESQEHLYLWTTSKHQVISFSFYIDFAGYKLKQWRK